MTTPRCPRSPRSVALSTGVYRWLLYVYPGAFRRAYGREMTQVFRQTCRAAHARAGLGGVALLWLPLLGDVLINAVRERAATLRRGAGGGGVMGINEAQAGKLWIGWTAAAAVAWGGGLLGATLLVDATMPFTRFLWRAEWHLVPLLEIAAQGLLLVVAQAALLRRYAPQVRWWAWATAGGVFLTLAATAAGVRGDSNTQALALGVILLCEGAVVGGTQWLALRRQVAGARWWVLATALCWPVGAIAGRLLIVPAFLLSSSALTTPWGVPAVYILGATLGGALYGALLGRLLVVLLRQTPQVADPTA